MLWLEARIRLKQKRAIKRTGFVGRRLRAISADWPELVDQIASGLNPIHDEIFRRFPMHYYWATYQSEWATDIVFRTAEDLRRLYPLLVHHAMTTFSSPDVLRFLGKRFTAAGHINGHVKAEVTSDLKRRQSGGADQTSLQRQLRQVIQQGLHARGKRAAR